MGGPNVGSSSCNTLVLQQHPEQYNYINNYDNGELVAGFYPEIEIEIEDSEEWNWDFYYAYRYTTNTYWVCQFYRRYLYNPASGMYDISTDEIDDIEWSDTGHQ